ncbi:MAG TPA: hypothetical protein RMH85_07120 [Polyangiaceae bacterium LLY-WYZ-15_(1-7)]|nr:hypothetical protein [Myxococcales bacterium]MAT28664.1 hypothetical protein [Sandaracinus sp.]HJK91518.1 hypothetical protein [Polyangiaceae bacterium LLY-WYZ-15_(1-7)]MBJ73245.1 hypothetical protein [Sandaracinus sp.]HJL05222.1 hypothetical protein [Polyangiaceae bacterium LLY-WYZ-15_(1-7)]
MRWRVPSVLSLLIALACVGCGDEGPAIEPTYANVLETVQVSCGAESSSCHGGSTGGGSLSFEALLAEGRPITEALVNVPSCEYDLLDRVEPGSPEESWLWIKLSQAHDEEGRILFEPDPAWDPGIEPRDDGSFPPSRCPNVEDGALTFGYQMPLNAGAPSPLPDDQLRLFHDWIEAGAPGPAE